jgi:hypothetical protein
MIKDKADIQYYDAVFYKQNKKLPPVAAIVIENNPAHKTVKIRILATNETMRVSPAKLHYPEPLEPHRKEVRLQRTEMQIAGLSTGASGGRAGRHGRGK